MEIVVSDARPSPPPPKTVTITMTESEAGQLMAICDAASIEATTSVGHCFVTEKVANIATEFWRSFYVAKIKEQI